jgi:hypothetical protein
MWGKHPKELEIYQSHTLVPTQNFIVSTQMPGLASLAGLAFLFLVLAPTQASSSPGLEQEIRDTHS